MMKLIAMRIVGAIIVMSVTPQAFAASAPLALTNNTTYITTTSARIWADIDANGAPTSYWFEYGTSYGLGNQVGFQSSPNSGRANVYANLFGLQPNTTYYYRVVAQNAFGVAQGETLNFTTSWTYTTVGASGGSGASSQPSQAGIRSTFGVPQSSGGPVTYVPPVQKTTVVAKKPSPTPAVKPAPAVVVVTSTPATSTAVAAAKDKGSFLGNVAKTITNVPGYIWFFTILLLAILFVTFAFFRMLRGRAIGDEEPEHAAAHH